MDDALLLIAAAVIIIVVVSVAAKRFGIAAPVALVVVGLLVSLVPGVPTVALEPEWILIGVLPPLLYSAAVNMPTTDFRRDFGAIGALSVLLVIASAFASGAVIYWLLPDLSFASAVALGAVISPPDAVAATSIGKRLGLPSRLVTILEGEGLVNDATALVLMRTAIAATAGGISLGGALGDFAYAVVVAVVVGFVVGAVSVWGRSKVDDPVLTSLISFVVPFLAYIPAEELGASGVLAVVVTGLFTGATSVKHLTPHDRMAERTNWRTISLILESGVFLLMGFQLMDLVGDVIDGGLSVGHAVLIGMAATAVLIAVRCVFVIPLMAWLRNRQDRSRDLLGRMDDFRERVDAAPDHPRKAQVERRLDRVEADAQFYTEQMLGWRGGAVIAWSGMRGVVTLAAAQSLPHSFPYRSELTLIAFTVAIVTLIGHGSTLPWLIRTLGVRGDDEARQREDYVRLVEELSRETMDALDSDALRRADGSRFSTEIVEQARERTLKADSRKFTMKASEQLSDEVQQRLELQRMMAEARQEALLEARSKGTYRSSTIRRAQGFLDAQATRFGIVAE